MGLFGLESPSSSMSIADMSRDLLVSSLPNVELDPELTSYV